MGNHKAFLGRLTIPSSGNASNVLAARELSFMDAMVFYAPAAFTGTISVHVSPNEQAVAADCVPLLNNGDAVTVVANGANRHDVSGFEAVMVKSSGTEAAERVIDVYAILVLPDGN